MPTPTERAEKISRQRALAAPVIGILLLIVHQGVFFNWNWSEVNYFARGLWAVLALASLVLVVTGGNFLVPKAIRELANDEVTQANWSYATASGFGVAMGVSIVVFVMAPIYPLEAQRAAHLIFSTGMGLTLVLFGARERKSLE